MSMQVPSTIQNTSCFNTYLAYINAQPRLNEAQERSLFLDYREHDNLDAAQKIILSHLRFVVQYKLDLVLLSELYEENTHLT